MLETLIYKPLSRLVTFIITIRHLLYDRGFFSSTGFHQPIIKLGNLSFGGTGKTPHTLFIANHYLDKYACFILSRGYGRDSQGIQDVQLNSDAKEVGDEPLMMKSKSPHLSIVVSSKRVEGIQYINDLKSTSEKLIILDDALQHRKLASGFQILLTDYAQPFYRDELFPLGNLRDIKTRASQADIIIVSKSEDEDHEIIRSEIQKYSPAQVFFSKLRYGLIYDYYTKVSLALDENIIGLSALANSSSFVKEINLRTTVLKYFQYKDHYRFTENDVLKWIEYGLEHKIRQIITSEKDAVKLGFAKSMFEKAKISLVVLPVEVKMSEEDHKKFFNLVDHYIYKFNPS